MQEPLELLGRRRVAPEVVVDLAQPVVVAAAGDEQVEVGGDPPQLGAVGLGVVLVVDLDPGEPEEKNIYEASEAGKTVRRVPMTLGEALEALEADEVVRSALPGEMYRVFMHYKRDEWERYCAQVSDWDVKEYLDVLP